MLPARHRADTVSLLVGHTFSMMPVSIGVTGHYDRYWQILLQKSKVATV
jgi:hypothetical protein